VSFTASAAPGDLHGHDGLILEQIDIASMI